MTGSGVQKGRAILIGCIALLQAACASLPVVDYPSANQDGRIRFLVIHFTDENFQRSLEILTKPSKNPVSAHYLVSRAGEFGGVDKPTILRLVDESQRAWHAGPSRWQGRERLNDQSIGIEIVYESHCPRDTTPTADSSPWDLEPRCAYPDYPPDQIATVTRLAEGILNRHPDIDPTRVVAHADIQPGNKTDPGPRFPWQQLAAAGVGAWPDEATVGYYREYFSAHPPSVELMQEALAAYGYGVESTGSADRRTRDVLFAFQSHFLPDHRSGGADPESAAVLFALLTKYRVQELNHLHERYPELPPAKSTASNRHRSSDRT